MAWTAQKIQGFFVVTLCVNVNTLRTGDADLRF